MSFKYISMFSGIECLSLAIDMAGVGWEPVCFAEPAPYPAALLAHHYPHVPNVGDIASHDWRQYRGKAEIVVGGSPCQAFSTAGRRRSLSDDRGNLTLKFVEAINDIDPEIVLWENVPGVLSVKDNAFGCCLAALAGGDSPLVPPAGKKWTNSGVVVGRKRSIAWRILDAQYFGVPQRRRRVFLVATRFGGGLNPAEILLKPESMLRNLVPREKAGKEAVPDSRVRAGTAGKRIRDRRRTARGSGAAIRRKDGNHAGAG